VGVESHCLVSLGQTETLLAAGGGLGQHSCDGRQLHQLAQLVRASLGRKDNSADTSLPHFAVGTLLPDPQVTAAMSGYKTHPDLPVVKYLAAGPPLCTQSCWSAYIHDKALPEGTPPTCELFSGYFFGDKCSASSTNDPRAVRIAAEYNCTSREREVLVTKCLMMGCDNACDVDNHYVAPGTCNMYKHKHESMKCYGHNAECQRMTLESAGNQTQLEAAYCNADSPCKLLTECLGAAYEASGCMATDEGTGWKNFNYMMGAICDGRAFDHLHRPVCVEECYTSYLTAAGLGQNDPPTCKVYEDYIFGDQCLHERENMKAAHANPDYLHTHDDGTEHSHKHHGFETDGEGVYHEHPMSAANPWRE
jgi:hypothetical protein